MNADLLKSFLGRLKKAEFTDFLQEWDRLPDTADVFTIDSRRNSKRQFVSTALKDCKAAGVSGTDIDEFALLHVYRHSTTKVWTSFEIKKNDENTQQKSLAPAALRQKLWKELSKYFTVRVCVLCRDEAFWIRVVIEGEGAHGAESILYAVHYPHTKYFFATNIKASLERYVSQAFCSAVGGIKVEPINLKGRSVKSLAQLTVSKEGQGEFSKYSLNQVDNNPLATQKRKRQDVEEEDFDVHIVNENVSDKRRRHSYLEKSFGSNVQPTLETVTYEMKTDFKGLDFAPGMSEHDGLFHCRVRFEGKSVIEGMRQLGRAGLADLPMKPHVGRIHSYAQNHFLLQKKERKNDNTTREG